MIGFLSKKTVFLFVLFAIGTTSAYSVESIIVSSTFTATTSSSSITPTEETATIKPTFESTTISQSSSTATTSTDTITPSSNTATVAPTFTTATIAASPFTATSETLNISPPTDTFKAFTVKTISSNTFSVTGVSSNLVSVPVVTTSQISSNTFSVTGVSSNLVSVPVVTTSQISSNTFSVTGTSMRPDQQIVADNEPEFIFDSDEEQEELIITSESTTLKKIIITEETPNPKLNFENILTIENDGTKSVTYPQPLELDTMTPELRVYIDMPSGIKIMGESDWNGVILLPTFKETSTVDAGTDIVTAVIEIGLADKELTFDIPVRIAFDGKAGEHVSFERNGISTAISTICEGDSESSVITQLGGTGECTITSGVDQVIWTFHYTTFFTSTPQNSPQGNGGGGDSTPPSFVTLDDSEFPLSINGKNYGLDELLNLTTKVISTGEQINLRIKMYDNEGAQNIQHVSLYVNQHGTRILNDLSETEIIFEKGRDIEIIDPHELIESASIVSGTQENTAIFDFDIVFSKEMDTSDLLFRVWDTKRNSVDLYVPDALTVLEESSSIISSDSRSGGVVEFVATSADDSVFSWEQFDSWAGYSESELSDKEFLEHVGIEGEDIPNWVKQYYTKWIKSGLITFEELVTVLNYLKSME